MSAGTKFSSISFCVARRENKRDLPQSAATAAPSCDSSSGLIRQPVSFQFWSHLGASLWSRRSEHRRAGFTQSGPHLWLSEICIKLLLFLYWLSTSRRACGFASWDKNLTFQHSLFYLPKFLSLWRLVWSNIGGDQSQRSFRFSSVLMLFTDNKRGNQSNISTSFNNLHPFFNIF